ncbi:MAG: tetratricopeptide repeat protein [Microgenomates group bacterium]
MAKIKIIKFSNYQIFKKSKSWLENKIAKARKLAKPRSARFYRATKKFGSLGVVILIALSVLGSFFLPKNQFQLAKERLIKNPNDFEAHLVLAEEFLKNNQFEEAEKELKLAQANPQSVIRNQKIDELWRQKHYSDPKDIRQLITAWEKIVEEKPNYRDGYLQLAYLHYKIFESKKAKEYLEKALNLDPNYEPARELEKIIAP